MNHGLSDQVRAVALEKYVRPALVAGKSRFSVAVRDLMQHLQTDGFPERNWPQVCTAIQARKFLRAYGLEIESVDGPPKKLSPTVVVRYRLANRGLQSDQIANLPVRTKSPEGESMSPDRETPEEWAHRLTGKLFGLLKDEFSGFGGGEAFLRWVRSEDEDEAA